METGELGRGEPRGGTAPFKEGAGAGWPRAQDSTSVGRLLAQEGQRRDVGRVLGRTDWPGRRDSAACAVGWRPGNARLGGLDSQLLELLRT